MTNTKMLNMGKGDLKLIYYYNYYYFSLEIDNSFLSNFKKKKEIYLLQKLSKEYQFFSNLTIHSKNMKHSESAIYSLG